MNYIGKRVVFIKEPEANEYSASKGERGTITEVYNKESLIDIRLDSGYCGCYRFELVEVYDKI